MTGTAWAFMLSTWAVVIGCMVYCFWKLLGSRSLDSDE